MKKRGIPDKVSLVKLSVKEEKFLFRIGVEGIKLLTTAWWLKQPAIVFNTEKF